MHIECPGRHTIVPRAGQLVFMLALLTSVLFFAWVYQTNKLSSVRGANEELRAENAELRGALISAHAQLDWSAAGHTGPRPAPVYESLVYYSSEDLGSPDGLPAEAR